MYNLRSTHVSHPYVVIMFTGLSVSILYWHFYTGRAYAYYMLFTVFTVIANSICGKHCSQIKLYETLNSFNVYVVIFVFSCHLPKTTANYPASFAPYLIIVARLFEYWYTVMVSYYIMVDALSA